MEWYNSFAEMLVSLLPLVIAVIATSFFIEDDEKKSDGNDYHNIILPREDWTQEMEDEFQAMCEEERRIAREKWRRKFERIIQQLKKNGAMPSKRNERRRKP